MTSNLERLKDEIKEQPFVLFLGAGTSFPLVPLWNELLDKLFNKAIFKVEHSIENKSIKDLNTQLRKLDPCFKATVIKRMLGKEYLIALQREIYSHQLSSKDALKKAYNDWKLCKPYEKGIPSFLFIIADFIKERKIQAVVTYNYDCYLSMVLDGLLEKNTMDVFKKQTTRSIKGNELLIYHVHGFIPAPNMIIKENPENIVLAYDEYFSNMMEPYSWQTTTQLHFLMNYNCLFLGTSLSDWNMLRILAHGNKYSGELKHYIITDKTNYGSEEIQRVFCRIKTTVYEEVGIKTIYSDDYEHAYKILKDLI